MSEGPIFVGQAPLPIDTWVRARARMACGCTTQASVRVATSATPEVVFNRYGSMIAFSLGHTTEHIHACQAWLKEHDVSEPYPEWYIDHEPGFRLPEPLADAERERVMSQWLGDYDGQGKSAPQETVAGMWIIVYLFVALALMLGFLVGLWLWL